MTQPTEQQLLTNDDPRIVAWNNYKQTEAYANAMRWLAHEEHREGSMWASFIEGWTRAIQPTEQQPAQTWRDLGPKEPEMEGDRRLYKHDKNGNYLGFIDQRPVPAPGPCQCQTYTKIREALEDMMREYESKWSDEPIALIQARKALALPCTGKSAEEWKEYASGNAERANEEYNRRKEIEAERDELKRKLAEAEEVRDVDNELIRALAHDAGITLTAPDDMLGKQWEQFHDGVIGLKRDLEAMDRSATDHCRRADTAEAAVGENCRTIAKLEKELAQIHTTLQNGLDRGHRRYNNSSSGRCRY